MASVESFVVARSFLYQSNVLFADTLLTKMCPNRKQVTNTVAECFDEPLSAFRKLSNSLCGSPQAL